MPVFATFPALLLQATPAAAARQSTLDPVYLVMHASLVVKLVMLLLVLMSLVSWFVVGTKWARLRLADADTAKFLDLFWDKTQGNAWTPERLEGLYSALATVQGSPVSRVFHAGYVELARISSTPGVQASAEDLDNVERALRRAKSVEMTALENNLPILATTGSVGPFIGLFGTVWGIMNSFLSIGAQRGATLDVVAPGIAEALIATAIGLVAAIPAVMSYNYFVRRIQVLESETDNFVADLLNIVRRHFLR